MTWLRRSCARALCWPWSALSEILALWPRIRNIFMVECFIVFSEVIAFLCLGSHFAVVRTLLPSHRIIGADPGSARANQVGEASIAPFAPPTSRRGITEGREGSAPSQPPDWSFDLQPKCLPGLDSGLKIAPQ